MTKDIGKKPVAKKVSEKRNPATRRKEEHRRE